MTHFAAGRVVGQEQQSSEWVGVDMALEAHSRAVLNIEHHAVAFIPRCAYALLLTSEANSRNSSR